MKKLFPSYVFILFALMFLCILAKAQKIDESLVPKAVAESFNNNIGFPVESWIKLTLSNGQVRYVAVVQQMDQTSGKTLQNRYRYNESGRLTSFSQYRGDGKGESKDFLVIYLGSGGVSDALLNNFKKITQNNTLISFEGFTFSPGNKTEEFISTHRIVYKDKKGQKVVTFLDSEGKEIDMTKYPIRRLEAEELD
jgi:hypothetical protein